ncbi:cytidylate kinase [Jeotgalicoccus coquinae]|uniref:Cytidylate kinase n=1 Tax=Jeotgalicoccus coquinae TaxID=709509 RepID=A0A6V7R8Y8_9STAP|nr:(d)CMP kinase [Jeotgalicoccus coquinae]MBB6422933.1 cytidylate kinase [Jeotgalicoccus coquinae]GGE12008.1 cytidylate kinase [Jeotgalicoccus coquinae]CAD2073623.1 Cytidylate kinase [Jeotgalicoccus coquinae]
MSHISIAIDGPAAAGKSTIAKRVAKKLEYLYIDTGAMYRAVTLYVLEHGDDIIQNISNHVHITFGINDEVYLNDKDVSAEIRSPEVTNNVSRVAAIGEVRTYLVDMQREISTTSSVVMDGRDIGTTVLPDAEVKIFMQASPKVRAERRLLEETARGNDIDLETLTAEIIRRDEIDSTREISPLVQADDAVLLDTSHLSIEEAEAKIIQLVKDKLEVQ